MPAVFATLDSALVDSERRDNRAPVALDCNAFFFGILQVQRKPKRNSGKWKVLILSSLKRAIIGLTHQAGRAYDRLAGGATINHACY
jgi:hypothetical protein